MLTLYDFVRLSIDERAKAVRDKGIHLDSRQEKGHTFSLYSLYSFYVEVRYDPAANQIRDIVPFKSLKKLDSYLDRVSIEGLSG